MVDTINSNIFIKNLPKLHLNPLKTLEKLILSFYRRYYDPNATYARLIVRRQFDKFVIFSIDISINGVLLFLAIYGTYWIINNWPLNSYGIIFSILIFGLDSWLFTKYYAYIRTGYKRGVK